MKSTLQNVSLASEQPGTDQLYLVVGDSKFHIAPEEFFGSLGFKPDKVQLVAPGTLSRFIEKPLRAGPATRPSDVFFDCQGPDVLGNLFYNCQDSHAVLQFDILVGGWLSEAQGDEPDSPSVNVASNGIEDIHYNLRLDPVFVDRMYGPGGLSLRLDGRAYPGNPQTPDTTPLPFAAGPPLQPGGPNTNTYNSWTLPGNGEDGDIHGELNSWHTKNTADIFHKAIVGRGAPPAGWMNLALGTSDTDAWFPFNPLNPDGGRVVAMAALNGKLFAATSDNRLWWRDPVGANVNWDPIGHAINRPLRPGDYVIMRGPLWEDHWHDPDPWDVGPTRHHAWIEMHPIDWVVRVAGPQPNAHTTRYRDMVIVYPIPGHPHGGKAQPRTRQLNIAPIGATFAPSMPGRILEIRNVQQLDDVRPAMNTGTATVQTAIARDHIDITGTVTTVDLNVSQGRIGIGRWRASWLIEWSESDPTDQVWIDDDVPPGAQGPGNGEGWHWITGSPKPFLGTRSHESPLTAGIHYHGLSGVTLTDTTAPGAILFAMVWLDPDNPPDEILLQWYGGGHAAPDSEHRALWGADIIPWGIPGTSSRVSRGPLPFSGEWVRLEVSADTVGLSNAWIGGMTFAASGGRVVWDRAGIGRPG